MTEAWAEDLELALELGVLASEVALPLFHAGPEAKQKPDGSVVTNVDLEVERRLLEKLRERRPGDAVLSEESGAIGAGRRRWILDPIDGTSYLATQRDSWGTHVALEVDGELVLGLVTRPLRRQWWFGARGSGAFQAALGSRERQQRLSVSARDSGTLPRVMVWANRGSPVEDALRPRCQLFKANIDGLVDVASGKLEALVDYVCFAWDLAPAVVLVEEAGGRFMDHAGGRRLDIGGWFSNGHVDATSLGLTGK